MRQPLILALLGAMPCLMMVGPPPPATAQVQPLYLYVHDAGSGNSANQIFAYQVNPSTGVMTSLGAPSVTGNESAGNANDVNSIAYSATKQLLFTTGNDGINALTVNPNGTLTQRAGLVENNGVFSGGAVVELNNTTYVYTTDWDQEEVRGFTASAAGVLTELPGGGWATGDGPVGINAVGDLVFVINQNGDSVSAYRAAANGDLTAAPGSPFSLPTVPDPYSFNIDVDPSGDFVYVADCNNPQIFGFRVNKANAALTALPGSPFRTAGNFVCGGIAGGLKGKYFALRDETAATNIQPFKRDKNGKLKGKKAKSSVSNSVAAGDVSPDGKLIAVANHSDDTVRTFKVKKIKLADTETIAGAAAVTGVLFVRR